MHLGASCSYESYLTPPKLLYVQLLNYEAGPKTYALSLLLEDNGSCCGGTPTSAVNVGIVVNIRGEFPNYPERCASMLCVFLGACVAARACVRERN